MKTQTFLRDILKRGKLTSEIELEKALVLDRQLRLMLKEHPELAVERKELRRIIKLYENINWKDSSKISDQQIRKSERAESIVQKERKFFSQRKELIKQRLVKYNMTQQELGELLGHGKTYMSELMNGISPLSAKDISILHRLFRIKLEYLMPVSISPKDVTALKTKIIKLNKPKLKKALETA